MQLDLFICDAFTDKQFKGNSAAVVPLADWLSDETMQDIAAENNLSETAFIKQIEEDHFEIRWFSPLTEVDFCGHATLASSYVLFEYFNAGAVITFDTLHVGSLSVSKNSAGKIVMDFPNTAPTALEQVPVQLLEGLSIQPQRYLVNKQAYFAVYENAQDVLNLQRNNALLAELAPRDIVATASSDNDYDFISRYFWPANGGDEDPVTGSIHTGLAPFWAKELNKTSLVALQASARGGVLHCTLDRDRVLISGDAVLYLHGQLFLKS